MQASADSCWDLLTIGDAAPPHEHEVTAEEIVRYCRAARYENLVYTSQPAARETGLPGIIAPPSMIFIYAPPGIEALLAQRGIDLTPPAGPARLFGSPVKLLVRFQGALVVPGEVITSVTRVQDKIAREGQRSLALQVTAHNQRGEPVADYTSTYALRG